KKRRVYPIFGSMLYMGDRLQYWEGKANFSPTSTEIEVFVDGSAEDSMDQQHEFFQTLSAKWASLSEAIGKMLQEASRDWYPNLPAGSIWDHFSVASLDVPRHVLENAEWEITFSSKDDYGRLFTVHMKGTQPQQASVDD